MIQNILERLYSMKLKIINECRKFIKCGKLSKWYYYLFLPFIPIIVTLMTLFYIIYRLIKKGE